MTAPRRRSLPVRPRPLLLAALVALLLTGLSAPADAQEELAEDPAREVLAVLSPVVSPACAASGAATLLVPVVSGLVSDQIGEMPIPVSELLLDALGPVFVVCAELPASPGTQCQLDAQIAGIWPQEVGQFLSPPNLLGNLVDTLAAALSALGLPAQTALEDALVCAVPASTSDDTPPPTPPPVPEPVDLDPVEPPADLGEVAAPPTGSSFDPPSLGAPAAVSTPGATNAPTTTEAPSTPVPQPTVLASIAHRVPGGLLGLQVAAAVALALFLGSSWATSLRLARSDRA